MVYTGQSCRFLISCVVFMVLTVAYSQEDERRAVTEHQLMHDRGRSIQSLKRLIWLSSVMERLHTAETRSLSSSLSFMKKNSNNEGEDDEDDEGNGEDYSRYPFVMNTHVQQGALELLQRDLYRAPPPPVRPQRYMLQ